MVDQTSIREIEKERKKYLGTGGTSRDKKNQQLCFIPAFLDSETNKIYLSKTCHGNIAPMHLLYGLPDTLVSKKDSKGKILEIKSTVIVGFSRNGKFYTREQAAQIVANR